MRTFFKLVFFLVAIRCFAEEQVAVLKVDDEHFRLHGTNAPAYQMRPCQAVILDATNYTFDMPGLIQGKPLTKIIMLGLNGTNGVVGVYQLDWESGKTRYEISDATLTSLTGPDIGRFSGFKSGQNWIVRIDANYETNSSLAAWYGEIEVR